VSLSHTVDKAGQTIDFLVVYLQLADTSDWIVSRHLLEAGQGFVNLTLRDAN